MIEKYARDSHKEYDMFMYNIMWNRENQKVVYLYKTKENKQRYITKIFLWVDKKHIKDINPIAIDKLLTVEQPNHLIWECACGGGHLAERLKQYGYEVYSSDIIDRGYYGTNIKDFLNEKELDDDFDILTNPPYKFAKEFVLKALDLVTEGRKIYMFLKLTFLEGKARYKEFHNQKLMLYKDLYNDLHKEGLNERKKVCEWRDKKILELTNENLALKHDRDTWKKACELAVGVLRRNSGFNAIKDDFDYLKNTSTYEHNFRYPKVVDYFYQQAQKEMKDDR